MSNLPPLPEGLNDEIWNMARKNQITPFHGVLVHVAQQALASNEDADAEQLRQMALDAVRGKLAELLGKRDERAAAAPSEQLQRDHARVAGSSGHPSAEGRSADGAQRGQFGAHEGERRRGGLKPHGEG